ncbi:MAG: LPXTG cell wall anchor domain-containing protein [Vagococcus fluvialis]|uniref:LPXTG cell wall anchor domain-containing protein n=1 Tax=Vagococcus fluvialis TaxID=2738 RepID=UPI000A34F8B9|nr:LPXTG cell wall anchor domain-containing protein [Vagococcus fluvialis]MBO0419784.1 LPXTG cell wall anchor domain-containing protein [Vagococcus fluvialis]OTP29139.1 hypothetical protein A5798_002307 [Enterococcus sp. 6C8_DIV0013]
MKKHTNRFAVLTLMCVPFLVATTSLAQTEKSTTKTDTTEMMTKEIATTDTTQQNVKAQTKEAIEWDNITLKLSETDATGIVGKSHGEFELADKQDAAFKDIEISGHFKEIKNDVIAVNEAGEWSALKAANNEKVTLEYVFDKETQDELNETYPDEDFSQPFKTDQVNLKFSEENKDQETASISLEIVGGELKEVEGNKENGKQLKVKVKDGSEVTGEFTAIDSKSFVLDKEGNYSIPKEARYENLNQEVEFTLDQTSYDKLAALPENSGKTVEKTYKMTVTKKAQKDITIKFKNKGINTVVGGQGRLLLEDTVEGVKIQEIEKVKFKPLDNNDFLSIDELGNWKALKAGKGPLKPAVILDEKTMTAIEEEFKDYDINIESETVDVLINQIGTDSGGGTSGKKYEPVKTLPQTGEEKLRFASITGVVILGLVSTFFFVKRKKSTK